MHTALTLTFVISLATTHWRKGPSTSAMSSSIAAKECGGAYRIRVASTPALLCKLNPQLGASKKCIFFEAHKAALQYDSLLCLRALKAPLEVSLVDSLQVLAFSVYMYPKEQEWGEFLGEPGACPLAAAASFGAANFCVVEIPRTGRSLWAARRPLARPAQQMDL